MSDTDPEVATDAECGCGDPEQFIGEPADDDEVDIAVDAILAEQEDDLDGDGRPDHDDEGRD